MRYVKVSVHLFCVSQARALQPYALQAVPAGAHCSAETRPGFLLYGPRDVGGAASLPASYQ